MSDWFGDAPTWIITLILFLACLVAGFAGHRLRLGLHDPKAKAETERIEGYIVSGVLGLLALLQGFTLAMAVDRFDVRRGFVTEEADAIKSAYLMSQLLGEPHRARMSALLSEYLDKRLQLATAKPQDIPQLLSDSDRASAELWAASAAAFDSVSKIDFSTAFIGATSRTLSADTLRKVARLSHVPAAVLVLLAIYTVSTAAVLGNVLVGRRSQIAGAFVIVLLTLSLSLIIDFERPTAGSIRESQAAMVLTRDFIKANPPQTFDRWRSNNNS